MTSKGVQCVAHHKTGTTCLKITRAVFVIYLLGDEISGQTYLSC